MESGEVGRDQIMWNLVDRVKNFARLWSGLGTVREDAQPSSSPPQSYPSAMPAIK